MRTSLRLLPFLLAAILACNSNDSECTLADCRSGVQIQFELRGAGDYVFEVTVDGERTTCSATLPLAASPPTPCDRDGVQLILSGSALPADEHSLAGLELTTTTARSITVRATRDGQLVGESTQAPPYQTSPPPNGPDCPPAGCTFASYSFP